MEKYTTATYFVTQGKSRRPCENADTKADAWSPHALETTWRCRVFGVLHILCNACRQQAARDARARHEQECPEQYELLYHPVPEKPSLPRTYTETPKKTIPREPEKPSLKRHYTQTPKKGS